MRHLRRRNDLGFLALLALAMQLILSFGHTHAPRAPDANLALACRTFFNPPVDQGCPPIKKHGNDCGICWMVAAAGNLVLPEAPALALPPSLGDGWLIEIAGVLQLSIPTAAFDARGPPLSIAA